MKQVICISGHAQHGKDTTALLLKKHLERDGNKVLIFHYADLLKYFCKEYFGWDGQKDASGRTLLQRVGTDIVRKRQPTYWVDFAVKFLKLFEDEWDYVLIPDCRFPNEISYMYDNFETFHLRVFRLNFTSPLSVEQQNHPSETALDDYPFDDCLCNNSTVEDLELRVQTMIEKFLD